MNKRDKLNERVMESWRETRKKVKEEWARRGWE